MGNATLTEVPIVYAAIKGSEAPMPVGTDSLLAVAASKGPLSPASAPAANAANVGAFAVPARADNWPATGVGGMQEPREESPGNRRRLHQIEVGVRV